MKNQIFLGILFSVLLISCSKNEIINTASNAINSDQQIEERIELFLTRIGYDEKAVNQGCLQVDSAEWYVEAALNYSAYNPILLGDFSSPIIDTFSVQVANLNNCYDFSMLGDVFDTTMVFMSNLSQDKEVRIVDVDLVLDGGQSTFNVFFISALIGSSQKVATNPFGPGYSIDDNWFAGAYGNGFGTGGNFCPGIGGSRCDCSYPNFGGAPQRLTYGVNYTIPQGNYSYYVNVTQFDLGHPGLIDGPVSGIDYSGAFFGSHDFYGNGNVDPALHYISFTNNLHVCIDYQDMAQYSQNISLAVQNENPVGLVPIRVFVHEGIAFIPNSYEGFHLITFYYGQGVSTPPTN